jgi:hypothetical protein
MLGSTHRRIAQRIAEEMRLNEREASILEVGSAAPDEWDNFPHHKLKNMAIFNKIIESRLLFLKGDDECFNNMGIAFHYIQDRWTLAPRLKDKHTPWEIKVDSATFLDDEKLETDIKSVLMPTKAEVAYLYLLRKVNKGVEGLSLEDLKLDEELSLEGLSKKVITYSLLGRPASWSSPSIDLNFAYRICREICRLIVLPSNPQIDEAINEFHHFQSKQSIILKIEKFPKPYLPLGAKLIELSKVEGMENAIISWFDLHRYEVNSIACRNNPIEEIKEKITTVESEPTITATKKGFFRTKKTVTILEQIEKTIEVTRFRLSIRAYQQKKNETENLEALPSLILDFSSNEEAKFVREAQSRVFQEHHYGSYNEMMHQLLNIKIPIDKNLLSKILTEYFDDLNNLDSVSKKVDEFKKQEQIFWFDKNHIVSATTLGALSPAWIIGMYKR